MITFLFTRKFLSSYNQSSPYREPYTRSAFNTGKRKDLIIKYDFGGRIKNTKEVTEISEV